MKQLKRILLVLVVLVIIGLVVVWVRLNSIVRYEVQTQATNSLNLATELGGANVSVLGGHISLSDLKIASPQGFEAPQILSLEKVSVAVNYSELTGDPIRVAEVTVKGPRLVIEQNGMQMNIKAMMDQMPKPPQKQEAETGKASKPLRLIISKVQVTGATVVFHAGLPGVLKEVELPLPDITLKDVGSGGSGAEKDSGAGIKEIVMQVVTAMSDAAAKSEKLPTALRSLLNVNVSQIGKDMGQMFSRGINGAAQDLGSGINQGLKSIFDSDYKSDKKK